MPMRPGPEAAPEGAGLRRREWLVAALALLAGCGGVDSGGTGTGAPGQSTLAVGTIAGFGSVIVNGVRYDESQATIADDDDLAVTRADLRLGMRATLLASPVTVQAGVARAVASSVRLRSEVGGPIESIDRSASRLTVLGQRVDWSAATVIDGGVEALAPGQTVWIWGTRDLAAGRIAATRIEPRRGVDFHKIRGSVTALDLPGRTLSIGALTVSWASLAPADPASAFAVGRSLHLRLATSPAAGIRNALALVTEDMTPADRERAEVEGRISAFTSTASFEVDGVRVNASEASFPDGTAGLGLGVRVEVEGSLAGGSLVARVVKVETETEAGGTIEVQGTIESVDAERRTFTVRGTTVRWSDATAFDSSTAADLRVGREVEVRGSLAVDGDAVDASLVHVER